MISKYITSLALVVFVITFGLSSLQFATRSQVLSGNVVDETLQLEFTLDASGNQTYRVTPAMQEFLESNISFSTVGPARVVSSKADITSKDVSWTENRTSITATGGAMAAQLRWSTPADSPNGAHGSIFLEFPKIPGFEDATTTFHSGGYQKDGAGRYAVREVTTYQNSFELAVARFLFALSAGLPFGVLLHTICWAFTLKGERRSRTAAFPPQGEGFPRTFYPDPTAEWGIWLLVLGIGTAVSSMIAGLSLSDGFMSSDMISVVYIIFAIAVVLAFICAYFAGKRLLTVRLDTNGIAYARGRGDIQWTHAAWSDLLLLSQKSRTYRGTTTHWLELEFQDNRKKLKIEQSIQGYPALRDILLRVFKAA